MNDSSIKRTLIVLVWKPMHLQPVFRGSRIAGGAVSERLFDLGLCLPSGTAMTERQVREIAGAVAEAGR